jgi:hypothetical protein
MLGEQIGEEKGKVTGQRVLDIDESGTPKIETTFSSNAKFKGIDTVNTVTYGSVYYRTRSTGKLAFLDNLVGLFEHDSDEQGNASSKIWEWK